MIRVQVVENVVFASEAMHRILREEADFQIVGSSSCAVGAMRQMPDADIALVSLHLCNGGALELVQRLGQMTGAPRIVITGVCCPEEELLPFLDLNIAGYVPVESSLSEFIETLRMVHRGETLLSPKLAAMVMNRLAFLARARNRTSPVDPTIVAVRTLTSRECEVIDLIGRGSSNHEIAEYLDIEVGTVKNHVHNILRKLDVNSRRAAAAAYSRALSQRALGSATCGAPERTIPFEIAPSSIPPDLRRVPA